MRVAHIITRMIVGGAQENTLLNCQDLIRLYGDDVLLITGPSLGPEGELLGQGRGAEIPLATLPSLRRAINPVRDWRARREIAKVLREFRADVVHTHSAKGGVLGRLVAWKLKVPAILHTVHGAPFHPYQSLAARSLFRGCEKFAARRCHAMISVADAMTDLMVRAGVAAREKFTTIYSGMDVEPFLAADDHRDAVRRQYGFQQDDIVVGKIARLFHLKGHQYVIEASRRVIAACPHVKFLFVGDGILRDSLAQQIESAGLSDHFVFAGLVPPARVPAMLGAMDILIHASLREGLARALPQALIAGKPVISYDVDGAREVVLPDETGFLIEPKAIEPISDALVRLAADAKLRERMGRQGRVRFTDQFRHENMTRQIRGLYQRLLGQVN